MGSSSSCRDKGRMWGWVGALCLSSLATRFAWVPYGNMVALPRGQAQGPLIHSTPPLVPTGRGGRKRPNEYDYCIRLSKFIRTGPNASPHPVSKIHQGMPDFFLLF